MPFLFPCVHTWAFFRESTWVDGFPCNTRMNAICRLFLGQQKPLELFCLFPTKILVRLLVFLEEKLTATNQSKASEVRICFRIVPNIGCFLFRLLFPSRTRTQLRVESNHTELSYFTRSWECETYQDEVRKYTIAHIQIQSIFDSIFISWSSLPFV